MMMAVPAPTACKATPPPDTVDGEVSCPPDSVTVTGLVAVAAFVEPVCSSPTPGVALVAVTVSGPASGLIFSAPPNHPPVCPIERLPCRF